jgi:hypothetical protein
VKNLTAPPTRLRYPSTPSVANLFKMDIAGIFCGEHLHVHAQRP